MVGLVVGWPRAQMRAGQGWGNCPDQWYREGTLSNLGLVRPSKGAQQ